MTVLQRENFLLKTKLTETENKSKNQHDVTDPEILIEKLSKENEKILENYDKSKKEFNQQTDLMAEENRKILQKVALLTEERDSLKEANKNLRNRAAVAQPVANPVPQAQAERPKTPEISEKAKGSPLKVRSPLKKSAENAQNLENLPPNGGQFLLPAFLALERQLTNLQKSHDQLEFKNSSNDQQIKTLQAEKFQLEKEILALNKQVDSHNFELNNRIKMTDHETILKQIRSSMDSDLTRLQNEIDAKIAENVEISKKLAFHEENRAIIDADAKKLIAKGQEIAKLKAEIHVLNQKLKICLGKKSDKFIKTHIKKLDGVEVQNLTPEILVGKIELLNSEISDKNEMIEKYERNMRNFAEMEKNFKKLRENAENLIKNSPRVQNLKPDGDSGQVQVLEPSEKVSYQKQILHLEHQVFDSKKVIEKLQNDGLRRSNSFGVTEIPNQQSLAELQKTKKELAATQHELSKISQKSEILNNLLLEEKTKTQTMQASLEIEKSKYASEISDLKDVKTLLIESNEKLQMVSISDTVFLSFF